MHRSRGVIHRSRCVCGEAEMGHPILLAPFVAVIGAFAATTEVPVLAVKTRWQQTQESIAFAMAIQFFWLAVNKKLETRNKNTIPTQFSSHAHS